MNKTLLGLLAGKELEDLYKDVHTGIEQDLYIQPYAAVFHIVYVPLYALAEFALYVYFAYVVFYLCHAGHSGMHFKTQIVVRDAFGVKTGVVYHMRARANYAHIAKQHIEKLRGFVDMGDAEYFAYCGNALIVYRYLPYIGLIVHEHGAELKAVKFYPFVSGTLLNEKYRPFRGELYDQCNDRR